MRIYNPHHHFGSQTLILRNGGLQIHRDGDSIFIALISLPFIRKFTTNMIFMRRTLSLVVLLMTAFTAMSDNGKYKEYCRQMYEKRNLALYVPEVFVSFQSESPVFVFSFGEKVEELAGRPIFMAGPIVSLSQDCSLVMMDINSVEKPRPGAYSDDRAYDFPASTAWMLSNCHYPWAGWYIYATSGIDIGDDSMRRTDEEIVALQKQVARLRTKHERLIENDELTRKVGCDRVFIVRIPDMVKICTNRDVPDYYCPKAEAMLKTNATECYGVEFYKRSSFEPVKMLFFINGNNTTIDECVAKMAGYIRFE